MNKASIGRTPLLLAALIGLSAYAPLVNAQSQKAAQNQSRKQTTSKPTAKGQRPAAKKASAQRPSGARSGLDIQRSRTTLPQIYNLQSPEKKQLSLESVKPPRSNEFYDAKTKEAEYEQLLDREIKTLFQLSQQHRRSPNRGEIWLRLAERYVEKARLIEMRNQAEYDRKLKDYLAKRTTVKPRLETKSTHEWHVRAVRLYEAFIKDFPKDPKIDQALFFLGYNQFELGNTKAGERYYQELVQRFPDSVFVIESHFALGEFYFENDDWRRALENYAKVVRARRARLNTFALYKSAWCLYRLNQVPKALQALERVVRLSKSNEGGDGGPGNKSVNKLRLGAEALKDFVPFYAEVGDPKTAYEEFERISGDDKQAVKMYERLAFIYADRGNRDAASSTFKKLIGMNPSAERAAEYQYQIVLAYATFDQKTFRRELDVWLDAFGPNSFWARENAKNQKLVTDVANLQETTLRNNVLQRHQDAQNAKTPFSQQLAATGYAQYFKYFPATGKASEMQFFYAELLFDMGKYEDAARSYIWVADKDPKGPFHEKSVVNALLALEKDLPSGQQIDQKRGKSLDRMPLDPPVERFEKAALRYFQAFPKGEKVSDIKRRLGVLYYGYNHFDKALEVFESLVRENPNSDNGQIAGNLILDMYNSKGDVAGLADKGRQFLADPKIANSKFGQQLRPIMEKAGYLKAEDMAKKGDSLKAAKEFETFAATGKDAKLVAAARIQAAVNYEKGGDWASAAKMHNLVLATPSSDPKIKAEQNDSRLALARIYSQTGQLEQAAKQYQAYATANPKTEKGTNALFNAGLLYEALGQPNDATRAYDAYLEQSKKSDRFEVIFAQAQMARKRGQNTKAVQLYEKYLASARNLSHALQATFQIGKIWEKQNQATKATAQFKKTIDMYRRAPKNVKDETAGEAAESRFILAQETLQKIRAVRFGRSDKDQAKAAKEIVALRKKYIDEMSEVIKFDNGPFVVAALTSGAKMFDELATAFTKIPIPNGFGPEESKQYQGLIQQQINGFKEEAKKSYKLAVDKSQELEVYTSWTKTAHDGLAFHDPASSQSAGELASDSKAVDWLGM